MLKLLAVECPDGIEPLDVRIGVTGGASIVVEVGAEGWIGVEEYAVREATPDDIRAAFVEVCEAARGAERSPEGSDGGSPLAGRAFSVMLFEDGAYGQADDAGWVGCRTRLLVEAATAIRMELAGYGHDLGAGVTPDLAAKLRLMRDDAGRRAAEAQEREADLQA